MAEPLRAVRTPSPAALSSGISYGEHVNVSLGAAAVLVDLIGLTEKLLSRPNGQPLPPPVVAIRNDLRTSINRAATDAATDASVSASVPFRHPDLQLELDVNAAAKALGISASGVRDALRTGRLGGRKVGRQWLVTQEDIEMYQNRQAG